MKILLSYLLGYLEIVVEGYYIERFINICKDRKINIWNLKREKSSVLYARILRSDFKMLKEICRKTNTMVRISKKKGFSFILNRYKKRKISLIFFVIIMSMIFVMSNFIWNIEIIGNDKINKDEIMEAINNEGIKIGKRKSNLNTKDVINKIRLERDDIAWIGMEIKGTNLIVKIVEADKKPDIIDEDEFCNIVATKDGIVTKVNARKWKCYGNAR